MTRLVIIIVTVIVIVIGIGIGIVIVIVIVMTSNAWMETMDDVPRWQIYLPFSCVVAQAF